MKTSVMPAKIQVFSFLLDLKKNQMERNYILDQETAKKKLQRMAYEIVESNLDADRIILAGIRENGSVIASIMQQLLQQIHTIKVDLIHISLDKRNPGEVTLSETRDFNNQVIVLIDDVANSGRTMLYAMKPFLAYHPAKMQTLALVDRTHKTFPVNTDYIGMSLATTLHEHIYVETDGKNVTGAYLE
jgi:pyrimidine operon attenuation protein/uracil phosphoribosyltransferase